MDYCLVVFASATTVNRVKSVLKRKLNIESEIVQTPGALPADGCSYSLRIKLGDVDRVWTIVKNSNLSSKGVFRESDFRKLK